MVSLFTRDEVASHDSINDCWVILENHVYDVTKYLRFHPGGTRLILQLAGKDATEDFLAIHHSNKARRILETYWVGQIRRSADQQPSIQSIPAHWGRSLAPSKSLTIAATTATSS